MGESVRPSRGLSRQLASLTKRFRKLRTDETARAICAPNMAYRRRSHYTNTAGSRASASPYPYDAEWRPTAGGDNKRASSLKRRSGRRCFLDLCQATTDLFVAANLRPGELQLRLLKAMFIAVASRVFREELPANLTWLRAVLDVDELWTAVAIQFPRRSGKSVIQNFFTAVVNVSQVNGNTIGFHLTGRQGRAALRLNYNFLEALKEHPRWGWDEEHRNMNEKVTIRVRATGQLATTAAFPGCFSGSSNNVRGMGELTFCCMMDEYEFFSPDMPPTVLPMLANDAPLIMVSSISPGDRRGAAQIAYARYDDGRPAVKLLNWKNACDACKELGYEDSCTHIPSRPQHFQSRAGRERLKALMGPFDGAHEREMMNMVARRRDGPAFLPAHLEVLATARYDMRARPVPEQGVTLFVGFDPSYGGSSSAAAMITIALFHDAATGRQHFLVRPTHTHTHTSRTCQSEKAVLVYSTQCPWRLAGHAPGAGAAGGVSTRSGHCPPRGAPVFGQVASPPSATRATRSCPRRYGRDWPCRHCRRRRALIGAAAPA